MAYVFPFSAIVGQDEMKLAILIAAVEPRIGGVLVFGDRGTGKSTAVRALAALLPPMKVVAACRYGCDPADKGSACAECATLKAGGRPKTRLAPVPVVDLPLGATEDRVVGALDLERALTWYRRAFQTPNPELARVWETLEGLVFALGEDDALRAQFGLVFHHAHQLRAYAQARRQLVDGPGSFDPLRHHSHAGEDLVQGNAPAQLHPHLEIAALAAGAGEDQIAQARQTGESHGVGAQPRPEAEHFGQAPGDERRPGIISQAHAGKYPGADGKDVLQRSPQLGAGDIVGGVHPEVGGGKEPLDEVGDLPLPGGDGHRGGLLLGHFPGEAGAGDHGIRNFRSHGLPGHPLHGEQRVDLHALGGAEQHRPRGVMRLQIGQSLAEAVGRNRHQDHAGAFQGRSKFLGEGDPGRQPYPREKGVVDPVPAQGLADVRFPDPQADVPALFGQELRQGGAPAAGADHRDKPAIRRFQDRARARVRRHHSSPPPWPGSPPAPRPPGP